MVHKEIEFEYGDVHIVENEDGSAFYYCLLQVGGRNEDGEEYMLVLDDGPAQGERVYL